MIYPAVVSFISGILVEKFFGFGWSISAMTIILSLVGASIIWKENRKNAKIILVIGIFLSIGILRMSLTNTSPDPNLLQSVGEKISLEATLLEEGDERDTTTRYISQPTNSKSLILLVTNRFPHFEYGDKISVSGKLDLPQNFISDNRVEFDYISYLSKDKIHFVIYQPQIQKIGSDKNKIISALYDFKYFLIANIERVVPEPNASLLASILFGTKQSLGKDLLENFKKVGLIHIVVLSGYNITIIAIGIFYLTSFLGKRNLGFAVGGIAIVLFSLMVGLGATVIRASIMALIGILAQFLGRPADALRFLLIALFLMLFWNPLTLFYDPSFQLSFMATLGLILFSPFIISFIAKSKIGKFIPDKLGLREIVAATLAVQLFVLPLLIKMSGFVSLVSFLINPLVLPLVPTAMALAGLTSILGIFAQFISWPFGMLAYFITEFIIKIVEFSASLPLATIDIGSLPIWVIIVWYAFYGFIFARLQNSVQRPSNSN